MQAEDKQPFEKCFENLRLRTQKRELNLQNKNEQIRIANRNLKSDELKVKTTDEECAILENENSNVDLSTNSISDSIKNYIANQNLSVDSSLSIISKENVFEDLPDDHPFNEISSESINGHFAKVESFEAMKISQKILRGLELIQIRKPNKLQQSLLPALLTEEYRSNDLFIQTTPYSGKKTTFLIALLERINTSLCHPQIVILSPTKDLVLQITNQAKQIARFTDIKIRCLTKEKRYSNNIMDHLVVFSFGQLILQLKRKSFDLNKVSVFCFDEIDIFTCSHRFIPYLRNMIKDLIGKCQIQFYSTCLNSKSIKFINKFTQSTQLNFLKLEDCFKNVIQFYIYCKTKEEKFRSLLDIVKNSIVDKAMIFVSDERFGFDVWQILRQHGYPSKFMTGSTKIDFRQTLVDKFKFTKQMILIVTYPLNVGINFNQVELIINMDLTTANKGFRDNYLHRIRSCSKNVNPGLIITIVDKISSIHLEKLESYYNTKMIEFNVHDLNRKF